MIRLAEAKDASAVIDLVMIVLRDMELTIFTQLEETKIKELLIEAFHEEPNHRYGMNNALIMEKNQQVAGVLFSYGSHLEKNIDEGFLNTLTAHGFNQEHQLFNDKETFKNEWYLDTLVTAPAFRGQGVAGNLIDAASELAKQNQFTTLGLNVDKLNASAKRIYLSKEFNPVGELIIANHHYEHLQKQLNN